VLTLAAEEGSVVVISSELIVICVFSISTQHRCLNVRYTPTARSVGKIDTTCVSEPCSRL